MSTSRWAAENVGEVGFIFFSIYFIIKHTLKVTFKKIMLNIAAEIPIEKYGLTIIIDEKDS